MNHMQETPDTGEAIAAVNEAHAAGLLNSDNVNGVRVYAMNDCDWVVARSEEDARLFYGRIAEPEDFENMQALSAAELDALGYYVEGRRSGPIISFRARLQQLVSDGEMIPQIFATTEL